MTPIARGAAWCPVAALWRARCTPGKASPPGAGSRLYSGPRTATASPRCAGCSNDRRTVPTDLPPHGTRARYVSRVDPCRCPACTRANTRYIAHYRATRAIAAGRFRQLALTGREDSPG